ncbi:MAG TPA: radical SAM protein [Candidatus Hydrogenedentes bacterium]|nr:radical SAM protein [Candidatus Hydrogenedentota bacterium]
MTSISVVFAPVWDITRPWTAPAYLCSYARHLGNQVSYHDLNIELYRFCKDRGFGALWEDVRYASSWESGALDFLADYIDLSELHGDVVAFSLTMSNLSMSLSLARRVRIRYPKKKIIMGGHSVYLPHQVARIPGELADAVCQGEGEFALRDLLERGVSDLDNVPGLYLPEVDGAWRYTGPRPLIEDLDSIPWPRFEEINFPRYTRRFLPLVGSRGCVNRCKFCMDRYMMRYHFRSRSARHQVDELEYLVHHFDVEYFPYNDSLLNGDVTLLSEKTDEIRRRGLTVHYGGNLMVRKDMDEALFKRMRQSGFATALIGVESGSAETLKWMGKRHSPAMAKEFLRLCHNAGIRTELNFIVGFPTETEEHFQETLSFIQENRSHIDAVVSAFPYSLLPSEVMEQKEKFGIVHQAGDPASSWKSTDGANTETVRMNRLSCLMRLCQDLNLIAPHTMSQSTESPPSEQQLYTQLSAAWEQYWSETTKASPEHRAIAMSAIRARKIQQRNRSLSLFLGKIGLEKPIRQLYRAVLRKR